MADELKTGETPEPEPEPRETPEPEPKVKLSPDQMEAEIRALRDQLSKTNAESAGRRKRLRELEDAEEARRRATLTETERVKAERDAFEAERDEAKALLDAERIGIAVERAALAAGFEYPQDVVKLIDLSGVDVNEDGKIRGVDRAVSELARQRPGLVRAPSTHRPGTPPPRGPSPRPPSRAEPSDVEKLRALGIGRL
jgi:hypothetical protein